jgi:hypothetical protein
LAQLAAEGLSIDDGFRAELTVAFRKESELALRRSAALAIMNGLPFDAVAEREIVDAFAAELSAATPLSRALPSWQTLFRDKPAEANALLQLAHAHRA